MDSGNTKIKIDTTEKEESKIKSRFFSELKKWTDLVIFVYLCTPLVIWLIFGLCRATFFRKSFKNRCNISALEEYLEKQVYSENWREEIRDKNSELGEEFFQKIRELDIDCKSNKDIEKFLKSLEKTENSYGEKTEEEKDLARERDKNLAVEEFKEHLIRKAKDLHIPSDVEITLTKEKVWLARRLEKRELFWKHPIFFFFLRPLNIVSEKFASLCKINKDERYFTYFHFVLLVKSLIINAVIRNSLRRSVERFRDEKKRPLISSLLVWLELFINTILPNFLAEEIVPYRIPNFWKNRKIWTVVLIKVIWETFFSLILNIAENEEMFLARVLSNAFVELLVIRVSQLFSGKENLRKKPWILSIFINSPSLQRITSGELFTNLKVKRMKKSEVESPFDEQSKV